MIEIGAKFQDNLTKFERKKNFFKVTLICPIKVWDHVSYHPPPNMKTTCILEKTSRVNEKN